MPEPSVAPAHAAPPAYRPLSAGAVTALVLAIVLAIPAMLGIWWLEALPLLVVVLSWSKLSSGQRRGRGVAVAAGLLAVTAGAWAYVGVRAFVSKLEGDFDRLVTALEKDDRKELATWVVKDKDVDADAAVARWVAAYAKALARSGAYASRTIVRPGLWGPLGGLLAVPEGVEDASDPARPPPAFPRAFWFEAAFPAARVWVAGQIVSEEKGGSEQDASSAFEGVKDADHFRFRDLRFFVEKAK